MSGNPPVIEEALKVEGATVTLPVSTQISKDVFTPEWVRVARKNWNNFHFQMGGDHALYYSMHLNEFMPTCESSPNMEVKPLERNINPDIPKLKAATSRGDMTLEDYMVHPMYRAQACVMIHKGKVVYESYPGMRPTDRHLTASTGKISVGTVLAQLILAGKLDLSKPVTDYVPELKGTVWDEVTAGSVANMCTALDNEETIEAILNPDSPVTRFLASCCNSPRASTGKIESVVEVFRDQKKLPGDEKQGEVMRYSSINTTVLTMLIENITGKPFQQVFEDQVWSKLHAHRSAMFSLSPEGIALPVGFMMVMPEDYAKFGCAFCPSWEAVASERIGDEAMLKCLYDHADKARFAKGAKLGTSIADFNDAAVGNALQFDFIWEDGAIGKSGNLCQMIYIDPKRDFSGVYFSTLPFVSGYGEFKAGAFLRAAAKFCNGEITTETVAKWTGATTTAGI